MFSNKWGYQLVSLPGHSRRRSSKATKGHWLCYEGDQLCLPTSQLHLSGLCNFQVIFSALHVRWGWGTMLYSRWGYDSALLPGCGHTRLQGPQKSSEGLNQADLHPAKFVVTLYNQLVSADDQSHRLGLRLRLPTTLGYCIYALGLATSKCQLL